MNVQDDALIEIAGRSRGTPRIANRVLKRVRDFAQVKMSKKLSLKMLGVHLIVLVLMKMDWKTWIVKF